MPYSGVVIDPLRGRHRRQVVEVLARVFVALHVARREGQQLFSGLAIVGETRDSRLIPMATDLPVRTENLVVGNRFANTFSDPISHDL